ncbi:MAG TPA: zinc ribbon domain-containing protein [Gemmatimonadaceae bacterium]|nr:zinc ribbon domain-containing protein [Gemmatimonadaceae bacterium]
MPTYEFRCPNGHVFDKFFRTFGDAATELPCPECGDAAARQISGGAGLLFKGSGFYLTDYGKNAHRGTGAPGGKSGESAKGGESGSSGGESKSGGDAKPAAKPEGGSTKPDAPSSKPSSRDKG